MYIYIVAYKCNQSASTSMEYSDSQSAEEAGEDEGWLTLEKNFHIYIIRIFFTIKAILSQSWLLSLCPFVLASSTTFYKLTKCAIIKENLRVTYIDINHIYIYSIYYIVRRIIDQQWIYSPRFNHTHFI